MLIAHQHNWGFCFRFPKESYEFRRNYFFSFNIIVLLSLQIAFIIKRNDK